MVTLELSNHKWIDKDTKVSNLNIDIPEQLKHVKVKEVVDENGNWNWRILENWLPAEIMYKIATALPPDDSAGDDKQQWQGNSAKAFSITNIYHDICGFNQRDSDDKWKRVWKLKTPERVKHFIWLVIHDRILTNERKYKMGLGDNTCCYCGSMEETCYLPLLILGVSWVMVVLCMIGLQTS
jgi:hypothetical protein